MKPVPVVFITLLMLTSLVSVAAEPEEHELTAKIIVTSNYLWRGVTQTQDQAAVQGVIKYQARNGIILATGVSNIDFGEPQGTGYEQDWYAGYRHHGESVTWQVGYRYSTYPTIDGHNFGDLEARINWDFLTGGVAYTTNTDESPTIEENSGDLYAYVNGVWPVEGLIVGGRLGQYSRTRAGVPSYSHLQLYLRSDGFKFAINKTDLDGKDGDVRVWVSWRKLFELL